jgi:hypothetical protein
VEQKMKNRFLLAGAALGCSALLWTVTSNSQQHGFQQDSPFLAKDEPQKVALKCVPGGASAGTVKLINTSQAVLPANATIYLANFGGSSSASLPAALPPGAAQQVAGPPGAFKTCQAWFYKKPGN